MCISRFSPSSKNGHRHMHAVSMKSGRLFVQYERSKLCEKMMFISEKHRESGNKGSNFSYLNGSRFSCPRFRFSQRENLKRGQENRGLLFSIGPRVRVVRGVVRVLDLAGCAGDARGRLRPKHTETCM